MILGSVSFFLLLTGLLAANEESERARLRTGSALAQLLEQRRSLSVQAVPVRNVLAELESRTGICILLDRRIDPSIRLTLQTELIPTSDLFVCIAEQLPDAGVSMGRAYVCIGPQSSARCLQTLTEQNRRSVLDARRQLPRDVYAKLSDTTSTSWHDLATPREIITQLSATVGVPVANPNMIPHDLWHARELPPMSFVETATLLLAQFDLTFAIDARQSACSIVPIPKRVVVEQRHAVSRRSRAQIEQRLRERFPDVRMEWSPSGVRVEATVEQHERIASMLADREPDDPATPTSENLQTRLFTLMLPDAVTYRELISHFEKTGIRVRVDASLEEDLDRTVTVQLQRVPGTEFFPRVFEDLPVEVEVTDGEVNLRETVRPH